MSPPRALRATSAPFSPAKPRSGPSELVRQTRAVQATPASSSRERPLVSGVVVSVSDPRQPYPIVVGHPVESKWGCGSLFRMPTMLTHATEKDAPRNGIIISSVKRGFRHLNSILGRKEAYIDELENILPENECRHAGENSTLDGKSLVDRIASKEPARYPCEITEKEYPNDRHLPLNFDRPSSSIFFPDDFHALSPVNELAASGDELVLPRMNRLKCILTSELLWMQDRKSVETETFFYVLMEHMKVLERQWNDIPSELKAFRYISKRLAQMMHAPKSVLEQFCAAPSLVALQREKKLLEEERQFWLDAQSLPTRTEWAPHWRKIEEPSVDQVSADLMRGVWKQAVIQRSYKRSYEELEKRDLKQKGELEEICAIDDVENERKVAVLFADTRVF